MSKNLIGKRVRVQIGGEPSKDDDPNTVIGQDTYVHVPEKELHKYDKIVGEEVTLKVGDINEPIKKIIEVMQGSDESKKEEIIRLSNDILKESDKKNKLEKIKHLISFASGIATIATFIMDLKTRSGL